MNKNTKITLSALSAAMASAFMLFSYFPYFTYGVPALAGLFMIVPMVEAGTLWAFGGYIVSALLSLVLGEPESALLYLLLFGYYPILKSLIERLNRIALEWFIKFSVFNAACFLAMFSFAYVVADVSFIEFLKGEGFIFIPFIILCEIAFVFYDFAISRVGEMYMIKIHPHIKKLKK